MSKPIKIVCKHCKSDRVSGCANVVWSVKKQEWELDSGEPYDKMYYCEDCKGEVKVECVKIETTQENIS